MSFYRPSHSSSRELTIEDVVRIAPSVGATEAHESRSSRYAYIPTKIILDGMIAEGFVPVLAKQGNTRVEGKAEFTKHLIRLRHRSQEFRPGAAVREVVLINSHDGTSSYHLYAGLFRVVCLNGLVTGDHYQSVKVSHTGDVRDRVIEGAFEVLSETKRAVERADEWRALPLAREEQVAFAYAAHELRFPALTDETETDRLARVPVDPTRLLEVRRSDDRSSDLWTTLNVIQEHVVRGGQRGRVVASNGRARRTRTREVTGIDQSTALNRALWTLTERMAAIRAAA